MNIPFNQIPESCQWCDALLSTDNRLMPIVIPSNRGNIFICWRCDQKFREIITTRYSVMLDQTPDTGYYRVFKELPVF